MGEAAENMSKNEMGHDEQVWHLDLEWSKENAAAIAKLWEPQPDINVEGCRIQADLHAGTREEGRRLR